MLAEFKMKLQKEFPFMKRDILDRSCEGRGRAYNGYQVNGCECSNGWYTLIHELCQEITKRYAEDGISAEHIDLKVLQIKEKFGALKFYYSFEGIPWSVQAMASRSSTSLDSESQNNKADESKKNLRDDLSKLIHSYEKKSSSICEYCGKEGMIRTDMLWRKTLCGDCYKTYVEKGEHTE